jgi:capsular polysaccharide biosynthesis protein
MSEDRIIEIDFAQCFRAIFQKWPAILAMTGVGIILAGVITFFMAEQEDIYEATSSVYCTMEESYSYTQAAESIQMMNMYVDIITSSRVAERANKILGNAYPDSETILKMLTIDSGEGENKNYYGVLNSSIVIKIKAKSVNEAEAVTVANAMAEAYTIEMTSITGNSSVRLLDSAKTATVVYEAEKQNMLYMAIGAVIGMFIALAWIAIKEIFVINLNTINDATLFGKLEIIGVIPDFD